MFTSNSIHPSLRALRRSKADDAYTAWFNAQQRCTQAVRAWNAAGPGGRAAAYRAYVVELELEEMAAAELERLSYPRRAA